MRKTLGIALALAALIQGLAWAQAGSSLTGSVKDSTGGVVPGASISVRNKATGELRSTVSGHDGLYRLSNLPRGTYDVTAELSGFRTVTQSGVLVTVGDTVTVVVDQSFRTEA